MVYAGLKKSADEIADLARERAGLTEFASDSWREGLEILLGEIDRSPTIVDAGRKFLYRQYADALWNRLRVDDYVRAVDACLPNESRPNRRARRWLCPSRTG
jgi:hypothetical protein